MDLERIEQLRRGLGLTQEQAAQRAGMETRQKWNNFVSGRNTITVPQFEAVAAALGVEPCDLLTKPKPAPAAKKGR